MHGILGGLSLILAQKERWGGSNRYFGKMIMENTINHLRYEAYYRKISLLIEGNLTQEQLHGIERFKLQLPHLSVFSYKSMQTRIATKSHNLSV